MQYYAHPHNCTRSTDWPPWPRERRGERRLPWALLKQEGAAETSTRHPAWELRVMNLAKLLGVIHDFALPLPLFIVLHTLTAVRVAPAVSFPVVSAAAAAVGEEKKDFRSSLWHGWGWFKVWDLSYRSSSAEKVATTMVDGQWIRPHRLLLEAKRPQHRWSSGNGLAGCRVPRCYSSRESSEPSRRSVRSCVCQACRWKT